MLTIASSIKLRPKNFTHVMYGIFNRCQCYNVAIIVSFSQKKRIHRRLCNLNAWGWFPSLSWRGVTLTLWRPEHTWGRWKTTTDMNINTFQFSVIITYYRCFLKLFPSLFIVYDLAFRIIVVTVQPNHASDDYLLVYSKACFNGKPWYFEHEIWW